MERIGRRGRAVQGVKKRSPARGCAHADTQGDRGTLAFALGRQTKARRHTGGGMVHPVKDRARHGRILIGDRLECLYGVARDRNVAARPADQGPVHRIGRGDRA